MKTKTYIQSYCAIQANQISLNGTVFLKSEAQEFGPFSKNAYQKMELNYPKFFKMDNLSKLAFLGAELLLSRLIDVSNTKNIALLFANNSSSLDTDIKYQNSITDKENYFPSPAVFVYTLPNICLGEISIKHQLKSENSFFIFEAFNSEFMVDYATILIENHKADQVLCGWVDFLNDEYKGFLYLVAKEGQINHDKQTLETIFNI